MKEQIKKLGIVTLMIAGGNILVWIINIAAGGGSVWGLFLSGGGYIKDLGEAAFWSVVVQSEWWRLLTCGYIHMGVFHLFFNVTALLIVGGKIEKYLGHFKSFLLYHFGTVITALLWCLLFRNASMVGASLGIFIILGVYMVISRLDKSWEDFQLSKRQQKYLIVYIVIGCFLGIETIVAHFIGFVIGMLFGCLYARKKYKYSLDKTN